MKNPLSGWFRARDKPQDAVSAAPTFYFGSSGSGKSVTAQSAVQLTTVYEERLRIRAFAYSSTASTMCSAAPSALSTPEVTGMPSIVSVRRPFLPPARLTM